MTNNEKKVNFGFQDVTESEKTQKVEGVLTQ